MYAKRGEITLSLSQNGDRQGVVIIAVDQGPGIPDIERAMQYGYSTSHGVGAGFPGAKRLMGEVDVGSVGGRGTALTKKKGRGRDWRMKRGSPCRPSPGQARPGPPRPPRPRGRGRRS